MLYSPFSLSYKIGLRHTIDAAHRVVGHEGGQGKCARLHGHTYTFDVELDADGLDETGFVIDFGVIKRVLDQWDHRTLLWHRDPLVVADSYTDNEADLPETELTPHGGVVRLPFNPTAENMARYLAETFAAVDAVTRARVVVRETAKSRAEWTA